MTDTLIPQDRYEYIVVPTDLDGANAYKLSDQSRKDYFLLFMFAGSGALVFAMIAWGLYLAPFLTPSVPMHYIGGAIISILWLFVTYKLSLYGVATIIDKRSTRRLKVAGELQDAINGAEGGRYLITLDEAERFLSEGQGYVTDYGVNSQGVRFVMNYWSTHENGTELWLQVSDPAVLRQMQDQEVARRAEYAFSVWAEKNPELAANDDAKAIFEAGYGWLRN